MVRYHLKLAKEDKMIFTESKLSKLEKKIELMEQGFQFGSILRKNNTELIKISKNLIVGLRENNERFIKGFDINHDLLNHVEKLKIVIKGFQNELKELKEVGKKKDAAIKSYKKEIEYLSLLPD
jgi:hypothetical protein